MGLNCAPKLNGIDDAPVAETNIRSDIVEKSQETKRLETMIADGQGPLLISFYNNACADGVCGTQSTYISKLSNDLRGANARFETVDVDDAPELVEHFQITSLPSSLLFVDGSLLVRLSGLTDPGVLACAMLQHVDEGMALMARSGHICPTTSRAA